MGPWQIIALQEAADYVQHTALHASFGVASFRGCAILINRNTFECNVESKHLYIIAKTGYADWALEAVVARGRLRAPLRGGRNHLSIKSVHVDNTCVRRGDICINLILMIRNLCLCEGVDIMNGDLNKGLERKAGGLSPLEAAFTHANVPWPTLGVSLGATGNGQIVVAFQSSLLLTMSGISASTGPSKSSQHPSDFGQLTVLAITNNAPPAPREKRHQKWSW